MAISAIEKLRRFQGRFSGGERVLVVINADPDSIASAMAIKRLLWRRVLNVTISNINILKRPDNIAMVHRLGVKMKYIKNIVFNEFNRFVIVDSQPDHHECFAMFRPDVIIDHHPVSCDVAHFSDIRPEYGATASIMTEYIRAAKIKPSFRLATGLFHAIKTDTNNFERQTIMEDIRAFQFLYRHADIHLARSIEQTEIRSGYLKYFKKAIIEMVTRRVRLYVHLGKVESPDICVLIADFFMRVQSVKWSIISGIHDGKLIIIFRNDGVNKNAGKTAKKKFGKIGSAGGHMSMARAEIPLSEIKIDTSREKDVLAWIMKNV